jgi:DNA modification methylase
MAFGQAKHDTPFREVLAGFAAATVVDPFLGSGAVVIACEKLRRRCIGIEIDPRRVAVCLDRLRRWGLHCERTEAGGAS